MAKYEGVCGTTRRERVHYQCPNGDAVTLEVVRGVNVETDPELRHRLLARDARSALNVCSCAGASEPCLVAVPVTYHDPGNEIFLLVLPEALRHRELAERAALLTALAEDTRSAVPAYVRGVEVVYGPVGLERYLERRAEETVARKRAEKREAELVRRSAELEARLQAFERDRDEMQRLMEDVDRRSAELGERRAALVSREESLEARAAELAGRRRALDEREAELDRRAMAPARGHASEVASEGAPVNVEETRTAPLVAAGVELHGEVTDQVAAPSADVVPMPRGPAAVAGADGVHVDEVENEAPAAAPATIAYDDNSTRVGPADVAIERWIVSRETTLKMIDDAGRVRLAASVEPGELEVLTGAELGVRVQLHRMPPYPLVVLALGTHASLEGVEGVREPLVLHFDIAADADRQVLLALADDFSLSLELFDTEYLPVERRQMQAHLADNVRYILAAADEYLATITPGERSFARAIIAWGAPDYDRFGWRHPERREFRDDKLIGLDTPMGVRRAMAIAQRFSKPRREEYLFAVRCYPMSRWYQARRDIVARAVEMGLALGARLSQVALSEGIAESRASLVQGLHDNFRALTGDPARVCDLDEDAVADNWVALRQEAEQVGVSLPPDPGSHPDAPRSEPIKSETAPVVTGTISSPPAPVAQDVVSWEHEELIRALGVPTQRVAAARELIRRRAPGAASAIFGAVRSMTRDDAVEILSRIVALGSDATGALIAGLSSHKGFVRHGCALALGTLRADDGIEPLVELLLEEPTDVWREVARAVGVIGAPAIVPLASRLQQEGERAEAQGRVSWALAHIAACGGDAAVASLGKSRDGQVAAAARGALDLVDAAREDDHMVRSSATTRDLPANLSFSRRFFELVGSEGGAAEALRATPQASREHTGPAMLLDEADLLEAHDLEEDAEPLDENDLLPT